MSDLQDLLERATDRVEPPGLAAGALAAARRRRRTRRGVAVGGVVAACVLGAATLGLVVDGVDQGEGTPVQPAPALAPAVPQAPPTWDPRRVDDLPDAPADLAPLLPAVLEVPTGSTPALAEDPVSAAVLTIGRSDAVKVLGVDGEWRHVPLPVPGGSVALAPDGTRLLVQTADGVDVWDVPTGEVAAVPLPPEPTTDVGWTWLADGALVVHDLGRAWTVDAATGGVRREVDRDRLWDVGVDIGWSEQDESLAVRFAGRRLLVRDDEQATYANGPLSAQAVLDDGTVLLRVSTPRRAPSTWFVAWAPASGEVSLVMRAPDGLPAWSVAADLLD